jgi:hypothetical protein
MQTIKIKNKQICKNEIFFWSVSFSDVGYLLLLFNLPLIILVQKIWQLVHYNQSHENVMFSWLCFFWKFGELLLELNLCLFVLFLKRWQGIRNNEWNFVVVIIIIIILVA